MNQILLIAATLIVYFVVRVELEENVTKIKPVKEFLQKGGFPHSGDIPVLNGKIFRGQRVTIREHPYVASIRRNFVHYLTGTLLTRNLVVTVAHRLVNVPVYELGVVLGENYSDRGTTLNTVIFVILHQNFDKYTLRNDIGLLRLFEDIMYRGSIKHIELATPSNTLEGKTAFVTGWGRCDNIGTELCLPRSSRYNEDEKLDPMLRSVSFTVSLPTNSCEGYLSNNMRLHGGMLCTGIAREEDLMAPCLAVPGAPLVVNARLAGVLSWGFGCAYTGDLPLVYTKTQYFSSWILKHIMVQRSIKQENLTILFKATKAYAFIQWTLHTRVIPPDLQLRLDHNLAPLLVDRKLAIQNGSFYDLRDFIYNAVYHEAKVLFYDEIRHGYIQIQKLKGYTPFVYNSRPFLNKDVFIKATKDEIPPVGTRQEDEEDSVQYDINLSSEEVSD